MTRSTAVLFASTVALVLAGEAWNTGRTQPASNGEEVIELRPGDGRVDGRILRSSRKVYRDLRVAANGKRELHGIWVLELDRVNREGRDVLRLTTYSTSDDFPLRRWEIHALEETLEPVFYEYRELGGGGDVPRLSEAMTIAHRHSGLDMVIEKTAGDGSTQTTKRRMSNRAFDANLYGTLIAAFPLREGLRARFPVLHAEQRDVTWRELEVLERRTEKIGFRQEAVDVWVVRVEAMTYWVTVGTQDSVRSESRRPNGTLSISEIIDWAAEGR